jgi:hypothetical protein
VKAVERSTDTPPEAIDTWVATFTSFAVGDEAIRNTKLLIGEVFDERRQTQAGSRIARPEQAPGIWLGVDFLRAHRVLLSGSQRKMYVSYVGGPVFRTQLNAGSGESR